MTHRRRYCYPGARVDTIINNIDEFSQDGSESTAYVVLAGSNDLSIKGADRKKLMACYRSLITDLKLKSKNIIISSILPRLSGSYKFHNDAFNVNRELKWLCAEQKIGYINAWDSFYNVSDMYAKDEIHLSDLGSIRQGRIYNNAVKEFFRK